ncbi:MAG TPA: ABC transporter substrate-binding protein [Clostridiaceae bacterium]|nr:ABC transporter substrate-binding protein [Clostridiaceae bacterium]
MKKFISVFLALIMVFGVVAIGSPATVEAADEKVIKIGVFEPVTGENGGGGFQELLGIRYGHELFPTVEIDGEEYQIELIEVDNKSDRTEAASAVQTLLAQNVSVVIGSYGSGVSIAAGELFNDAQVPAIAPSATNPQVTFDNDFYFRVCFLDPFQGSVMAQFAKEEGATKAAVITQLGDDYSAGLGNFFLRAFEEGGGEIVANEQFQTNQTDFKAILTNIKAVEPDVIFAPSSITTAPLLIKQARELGIEATIMAGDTWENQSIIDNAGAEAEGVCVSTFFDENDTDNPAAKDFVEGFKEFLNAEEEYLTKNGGDGVAAVSALGYDAYCVAVEAIKAANSTDSVAIRDALVDLVYEDGVTGSISFDENGDANKDMAYIKIVEDGTFKFLKTVTVGGDEAEADD